MSLTPHSRPLSRSGQTARVVGEGDLRDWAGERGLTLREAYEAALADGVFPESLERNFPCFSAAAQLRLFQARVLIVGLGGLGGTLTALLARLGVGRLLLADGDEFSASNLNRQLLATRVTLGQKKAEVAARYVRDINPALEVEAIPRFLDEASLPPYLARVHLVLDGLDSLAARRDLFNAAQAAKVPLVHGAAMGKFGQLATILPEDGDAFRRIFSAAPPTPAEPREILAPTAALVATLQVQEAVRLLLGQPSAYHRVLAHFDGDTGRLVVVALG